jgi:hypothetical protein
MAFRGCLVVVAVLLLVPVALADPLDAPLPPAFVQAAATPAGVRVSWLPPADDGGYPVVAYWVERLDTDAALPAWERIATTTGDTFSFLDATAGAATAYRVSAVNQAGPSLPSAPTVSTASGMRGSGLAASLGDPQVVSMNDSCTAVHLGLPSPNVDVNCILGWITH